MIFQLGKDFAFDSDGNLIYTGTWKEENDMELAPSLRQTVM